MPNSTKTLLTYDLPLLAAANEQRGSAWVKQRVGVDVEGGVLSRDELIALKRFEQDHPEELASIWRERDQQPLLDLSARLRGQGAFALAAPSAAPTLPMGAGSLLLTVLLLALALLVAMSVFQFAAGSTGRSQPQAGLIYGAAVLLALAGWRAGRCLWRALSRESDQAKGS